ncbi:MAG: sugar transferase [Alicyclobacillaceae bacterium]|nr:sugar transferase [Alicyclobacillaceae bacterium]
MVTTGESQDKKILMMGIDLAVLYGSFFLAYFLRFHHQIPRENLDPFLSIAPWLGVAAVLTFYFFDLYSSPARKDYFQMLQSLIVSLAFFVVVVMAISFWGRGFAVPRSVIFLGVFLQGLGMILLRTAAWYTHWMRNGKQRVLIVGAEDADTARYARKLLQHSTGWFTLAGTVPVEHMADPEVLNRADILLLSSRLSKDQKEQVLRVAARYGKEVLLVPDAYELFLAGSGWQQVDDMLVFSITPPALTALQRAVKRSLDVICASVLLVLASPAMILLFILVPLTSKGPALYRQERLGERGRPYVLYKFRSMVQDAEQGTGPVLASEDDPRITPLGRFIRATRLDELPQLFNVLKGDMSLVGPRPERAYFVEQFEQALPHYQYRMAVKPGITGLAQVMANYSTTAEDKLRYDLLYIRNYSLMLDIKIMFQTLATILRKDRAAGVREQGISKRPGVSPDSDEQKTYG